MEKHNEIFTIQFASDADVHLNLVGEMDGAAIYRTIKHNYDLEKGDKSKLTIMVEISPLSEQHKRRLQLIKQINGKVLVSGANTTDPTDEER